MAAAALGKREDGCACAERATKAQKSKTDLAEISDPLGDTAQLGVRVFPLLGARPFHSLLHPDLVASTLPCLTHTRAWLFLEHKRMELSLHGAFAGGSLTSNALPLNLRTAGFVSSVSAGRPQLPQLPLCRLVFCSS